MKSENVDELRTKGGEFNPSAVQSEIDGIKSRLDEVGAALGDAPKAAEIAGLKSQIEAVSKSVADIPGNYDGLIKSLTDRVDELQTGAALLTAGGANVPEGMKAITAEIMDSEIYKSIHDANGMKAGPIAARGSWSQKITIPSFSAVEMKAVTPVQISDMAGGSLTAYRPGLYSPRQFAMNIGARIPRQIVKNASAYAIPYEPDVSLYGAWTTLLSAAVNGDPSPTSTATFYEVDGLMVGSVCKFYNASNVLLGSGTVVSYDAGTKVVTFGTNELDFDAAADTTRVVSVNYGVSAETSTKPAAWIETANRSFNLKVLASILPTTVQAINTVQGMSSFIEGKLPRESDRNLSLHLLYGDDGTGQLQGFSTYSGAQSYAWSDGVSGDNQIDALMRAANLVPWGAPISVVMSQVDFPDIQLLKASDGHYLRTGSFGMVPLTNTGGAWYLGPNELVFDYAVTTGDFFVVDFSNASEIADQDTASLMWGYVDDDFETNVIRCRYERTLAHAIKDPGAYVVGEWDAAP